MTKPLPGYDYERALVRNNESGLTTHRKPVYADIAKEIAEKYEVTNTKNVVQHLRLVHEQYLIDQKSTDKLSVQDRKRVFNRIKNNTDLLIQALDGLEPGLQALLIENASIPYDDPWMERLLADLNTLHNSLEEAENDFCAKDHYKYTPLEGFIKEMGDFFHDRIDDSTFLPVTMPTVNSTANHKYGRFVDFLMYVGKKLGIKLEKKSLAYAVHNFKEKKLKPKQKSHRK